MTSDSSANRNTGRDEETVHKDGYELTFYPGFASRAVVREKDGTEHELYQQGKPYPLPRGRIRPKAKHKLRLKGGKKHQNLTLEIHDPELRIARITIELYGEDYDPEKTTPGEVVETFNVNGDSKRCPPHCSPQ